MKQGSRMVAVAALLLGLHPAIASATVWNVVSDFSTSSNPNGAWDYGYGAAGETFFADPTASTFHLGPTDLWSRHRGDPVYLRNGNPMVAENMGATYNWTTVVVPTGVLWVHPGKLRDTLVQWTAPTAGIYSYSGEFELLDIHPTGVIGEVFAGATELYSGTLTGPGAKESTMTPGELETFSGRVSLLAGETLTFAVNNDGNFGAELDGADGDYHLHLVGAERDYDVVGTRTLDMGHDVARLRRTWLRGLPADNDHNTATVRRRAAFARCPHSLITNPPMWPPRRTPILRRAADPAVRPATGSQGRAHRHSTLAAEASRVFSPFRRGRLQRGCDRLRWTLFCLHLPQPLCLIQIDAPNKEDNGPLSAVTNKKGIQFRPPEENRANVEKLRVQKNVALNLAPQRARDSTRANRGSKHKPGRRWSPFRARLLYLVNPWERTS